MKIVLFGDSYAAGRLPHSDKDGALADCLMKTSRDVSVTNLAVSGSTARDWARGPQRPSVDAIIHGDADVAVGCIGGNDLFAALKDCKITIEEMSDWVRDTIVALTPIAKSRRTIFLLYPLPPMLSDASLVMKGYTVFIFALSGLVRMCGAEPLDLSQVLDVRDFDGADIHPSYSGYAKMADAILAKIGGAK